MRDARRLRQQFYTSTWRLLVGAALMVSSLSVLPLVPSSFVRGVAVGVVATAVGSTVLRVAHDGDGGRALRDGAEAERWTATDLRWFAWWRRLHRQRWYVVHSVGFAWGDVDHVLIGPGGVYAVDTKYRSGTGRQRDPRADVTRAQQQLTRATRRVAALVRQHAGVDMEVGAILVTHGRGWPWHASAGWRHAQDTLILRGSHLHRWHRGCTGPWPVAIDVPHDCPSVGHVVRRAAPGDSAHCATSQPIPTAVAYITAPNVVVSPLTDRVPGMTQPS